MEHRRSKGVYSMEAALCCNNVENNYYHVVVLLFVGFVGSAVGLLSVAQQLSHSGEPSGSGNSTDSSRVRPSVYTVLLLHFFVTTLCFKKGHLFSL